ncbi:MAG TPA: OmpA family protein [Anaeromyxobacteraceae bacterium]|nr:OmpA family protein [Anaeromyxobacteraceae bacterium]
MRAILQVVWRPPERQAPQPLPAREPVPTPAPGLEAQPPSAPAPHPEPTPELPPAARAEKRGDRIGLREHVQFRTDSDEVLPESAPLLDEVARILRGHPEITQLSVEGHSDASGRRAHNVDLSRRRAASLKRWLVERGGIDPSRVTTRGFGPDRPIVENHTGEGRRKNRRVELRVVCQE